MTVKFVSLLTNWWLSSMSRLLADIWTIREPGQSLLEAGLVTVESTRRSSNKEVRVCFRNYSNQHLLLCWIDTDGTPHHFYKLPCRQKRWMDDDDEPPISVDDHVEQSSCGHAFAFYAYDPSTVDGAELLAEEDTKSSQDDDDEEEASAKMPPSILLDPGTRLIGGYRPKRVTYPKHKLPIHKDDAAEEDEKATQFPCHLVTLESCPTKEEEGCSQQSLLAFCQPPPRKQLRGSTRTRSQTPSPAAAAAVPHAAASRSILPRENDDDDPIPRFDISTRLVFLDPTPVDTTIQRNYRQYLLAGGWPIFCTPSDWAQTSRRQKRALEHDFSILQQCLPPHAARALQCNTPLYINHSLEYGPILCPQRASGMCFHPHTDWLQQNGLHRQKVECVELYRLSEYMKERDGYWQPGGLLLHEYSHAYHFKMLPNGYDNLEVLQCYQHAMDHKLYDAVEYHKADGRKHAKKARAYACTDAMEYFAELSVAFLGGTDDAVEFNKWFPFNRAQLRRHDPRAYELLKRVWKMQHIDD
jgi:hypothetical protein